jgi:hypothetical protein
MKLNALVIDPSWLRSEPWDYLEQVCNLLPDLGVVVATAGSTVAAAAPPPTSASAAGRVAWFWVGVRTGSSTGEGSRTPHRRSAPAEDPGVLPGARLRAGAQPVGADRQGAIWEGRENLNFAKQWFAENTNPERRKGAVGELLAGSDVFIGVSGPGIIEPTDLDRMNTDPFVFALANPDPEIRPEQAKGRAAVIATGRSDFPNQINNVLAFPGIFRGALDAKATAITEGMKLAAASAIADTIPDDELAPDFIVPSVFDQTVAPKVAEAVASAARAEGVVRS